MQPNDDLKTAVEAMYRMALEGCQTSDEIRTIRKDVIALICRLEDIASDAHFMVMKKEASVHDV